MIIRHSEKNLKLTAIIKKGLKKKHERAQKKILPERVEIFFCGLPNPFRVLFLPLNFDVNYKFLNYSFIQMRIKTQTKAKTYLLYVPTNITSINYLINPNSTLTYLYAFIYKKTQRGETSLRI